MFQCMEKRSTATMAIQNPGMDTQNREKNENRLSTKELARVAEMTPIGHGDEQGNHDGKEHHFQGGGQPLGDQVRNFLVPLQGASQISLDRIAEPVEIPHVVRLIQAQFGANCGHRLLIGPESEHDPNRVARAEVDKGRDEDGDEEETGMRTSNRRRMYFSKTNGLPGSNKSSSRPERDALATS